jgi:hypothetical protein
MIHYIRGKNQITVETVDLKRGDAICSVLNLDTGRAWTERVPLEALDRMRQEDENGRRLVSLTQARATWDGKGSLIAYADLLQKESDRREGGR